MMERWFEGSGEYKWTGRVLAVPISDGSDGFYKWICTQYYEWPNLSIKYPSFRYTDSDLEAVIKEGGWVEICIDPKLELDEGI